ncbi:MAG: hypothetical protein J3K34DRAFT_456157, partial [Monoraphidium minutum]
MYDLCHGGTRSHPQAGRALIIISQPTPSRRAKTMTDRSATFKAAALLLLLVVLPAASAAPWTCGDASTDSPPHVNCTNSADNKIYK